MATRAMARALPKVWVAHERMLRINLTAARPLLATNTLQQDKGRCAQHHARHIAALLACCSKQCMERLKHTMVKGTMPLLQVLNQCTHIQSAANAHPPMQKTQDSYTDVLHVCTCSPVDGAVSPKAAYQLAHHFSRIRVALGHTFPLRVDPKAAQVERHMHSLCQHARHAGGPTAATGKLQLAPAW